ncbi:MAG: hypothetical protein AB2556_12840, partial [Candidatus Thiodiazotropha sp.]
MALEQQLLGSVTNLCLEVKMRSHTFQATTKRSHPRQPGSTFRISWHWIITLQADSLFEGLEKVFGSVVYLDLFIIIGMLAKPVVLHSSGDLGQLP